MSAGAWSRNWRTSPATSMRCVRRRWKTGNGRPWPAVLDALRSLQPKPQTAVPQQAAPDIEALLAAMQNQQAPVIEILRATLARQDMPQQRPAGTGRRARAGAYGGGARHAGRRRRCAIPLQPSARAHNARSPSNANSRSCASNESDAKDDKTE